MAKVQVSNGFSIGAKETEPIKPGLVDRTGNIREAYMSTNSYEAVFGNGIYPSSFTLTAKAGTGKTTWLLQHQQSIINFYKKISSFKKVPRCLFITNEMTIEALAGMCERLGIEDVEIAHIFDIDKILAHFENYDYIVIDSLPGIRVSGVSKKEEEVEATKRIVQKQQETNCRVGIIVHLTKDGKAKGDSKIGHIVDCNLSLHKGTLEYFGVETIIVNVEKNRNGPSGFVPFHITSKGFDVHYQYPLDSFWHCDIVSELPRTAFKKG